MTALAGRPGIRVLAWSLAGFVLLVMADRLAALGGTLRVTSAPGHGTQVTGRVPVAQDLPSRELVAGYGR